jgi:hypothetical protein
MPRCLQQFPVLSYQFSNPAQCRGIETIVSGQGHIRLKPELGLGVRPAHVNMRRLERVTLVRVEEEPEAVTTQYNGHGSSSLPPAGVT